MRTRGLILKLFTTASFLLLLLIGNMGSLRCESPPAGLIDNQPQAKWTENRQVKSNAKQDLQGEKSQRYKELEWMIKQMLNIQYQKLEEVADLEDNVD